jgi:curli production assembly/transport component CsgF
MRAIIPKLAIVAASIGFATAVSASQLTWTFVNPTFGGNALNGQYLLNTATGQGFGAKSGSQGPTVDLSGLNNALSNLGSSTVANPTATNTGVPASP